MLFGVLSYRFVALAVIAFVAICVLFLYAPFMEWRERREARERAQHNRELAEHWEATVAPGDDSETARKDD